MKKIIANIFIVLIVVVSIPTMTFAVARFHRGETLNPNCSPTDPDCTVTGDSSSWSNITGSISSQTDLQNVLNLKQSILFDRTGTVISPHTSGDSLGMGTGVISTTGFGTFGRVGVGTATPSGPFHVIGDSSIFEFAGGFQFLINDSANGTGNQNISFRRGGVTKSTIFNSNLNQLVFQTASADIRFKTSPSAEQMRITTIGNIGFGVVAPTAVLNLKAGTATAGTAPLKFTSGTSLAVAEAGAMEFATDNLYFTITTGVARKNITLNEGLTLARVPYATINGRLTDSGNLTFDGTNLSVLGTISSGGFNVGATVGIDSIHTIKDGDGIHYHHYIFTKGILTSYIYDTNP